MESEKGTTRSKVFLTVERAKRPPPTIMADIAVPNTAKITIEPIFLKKFP